MKRALLVSSALLLAGVLFLLVRAIPHAGSMVSVALEQAAASSFGGDRHVEGISEARVGWTAVNLAFVSCVSFVLGWLWVPLSGRVLRWAERQPAIKDVFHYKGVRFVSDAPTESLVALAVVALFPVWVLLPGVHHMVGRAVLPVPDHLIAESASAFVMCLPLAVGYGLVRHARRASPPDTAVGD